MSKRGRLAAILLLVLVPVAVAVGFVLRPLLFPDAVESQGNKTAPAKTHEAALPPGLAEALTPGKRTGDGPAFDIARIDPNGTSVFAGRGEPGTVVTVHADGVALGTAKVDGNGEWTFVTERKVSREAKLELIAGPDVPPPRVADASPDKRVAPGPEKKEPEAASAQGVTSQFLKNLEVMVAAARDAQSGADAKTKTDAPETGAPTQGVQSSPSQSAPERLAERAPPATAPAAPAAPAMSPGKVTDAGRTAAIPVPVLFVYNESTFTPEGRRAVKLLLEYLLLKKFDSISLSGHADERGTDVFNMDLSRQRLDAVAQVLRDGGYKGRLNLVAKGKSEPFTGIDRARLSREDLYQLDRRVELRITP